MDKISRQRLWQLGGRGRVFDNIFTERLWRTVKYEDIYVKDYTMVLDLIGGVDAFSYRYNYERLHQSLSYFVPSTFNLLLRPRFYDLPIHLILLSVAFTMWVTSDALLLEDHRLL